MADIILNSISLDQRNEAEIVEQAKLKVYNASGGLLNDFTENSPVAALIQGQAFAGAELLYYANQLPLALVIDFLKITGVTRSSGTKAKTTLTFTINSPQNTIFTIPEGFEVVDSQGKLSFFTNAPLVIPVGLVSGSVTATAEEVGSDYNISAYSITGITQPLTYLAGVTNIEAASGGSDLESEASAINRALTQIRLKNLVSADDYEQAAEILLGEGSVCKAIGLLGGDKTTRELGAVHLFLLNSNGEPANDAQINYVKSELSNRIQLGTALYVSPIELLPISAELQYNLSPGVNPEEAFDTLWEAYQDYLNPSYYPLNKDILFFEVGYALRNTGVIVDGGTLSINGTPSNIPIPNNYTLPYAYSLFMQLVDKNGVVYESLRGAGESISFGGFV
ncbi:MAG: baseplate J/gp47 family protein [Nostoc sp. DedVER02]|uniref:baseplate J/gp47 family protein n=1 Tax=unclassified Nostoc TaxID=2593658 RepID=UPI002AD33DA3|nr:MULTISPECIES: baseplate J/gp47 family protein [unclassified Nostoc]MDZ7987131.1 baseplate J/gp47 family protein [Nostoc sp. DedVER02]MDZ8110999.1 baseplate J/gp47 family protein [Nostoc sp. DedVER01b]